MRTVSFSAEKIQEELKRNFVCHAINTEGSEGSGASSAHAPNDKPGACSEGVANQNVQLVFLTPEGKIFHTASGYRGVDTLEDELKFSRVLFRRIQEKPDDSRDIVRTMHKERFNQLNRIQATSRSRSRRRSSGGGGGGGGGRTSATRDYDFAQRYPLLRMTSLERNPRLLVGSGASVFVSGTPAGGKIGG